MVKLYSHARHPLSRAVVSRRIRALYAPFVALHTGTYRLGPGDGTLSVHTKRTGAAAKAGHNLTLLVGAWEAVLEIAPDPAAASLAVTADGSSLRVVEGTGGMQALGDDDKANIEQTIVEDVLDTQAIAFRSSRVEQTADGRLVVQGELTLLGATRPFAFDIAVGDGGALTCTAVVKQSDWGMKPYSALFGALKVVDEVEVAIDARLPGQAQPGPQSL
jgi:polyisoprenoid-binding protein YceI